MHTYPSYVAPTGKAIAEFVREHPFAVIATSTTGAPVATHAPVVFSPGMVSGESLVGARLWGHFGRANAHWKLFVDQPEVLLVFSSSHAYVSPSTYGFTPAVPTLDYATVHLTGNITILDDRAENLAVVEQTVAQLEGRRRESWDPTDSQHVFQKILDGVVSFTIDIKTEAAMFKLSQDMPEDVHARVREDLSHGEHQHADVVALMERVGVRCPSGDRG